MKGIIGKKLGMTSYFDGDGRILPARSSKQAPVLLRK